MIRLLVRLPLVLALALPITWAGALLATQSPEALLEDGLERFSRAFPAEGPRREVAERAGRGASLVLTRIPDLGGARTELVKAGVMTSVLHLEATFRVLPVTALLVLSGLCAGLALRERLRDQAGYASPTAAGLARIAVGAGTLWLALFSASPVPASYSWLYASSVLISFGGALYAANLPLRL
jgi:hypothetical protein